MVVSASGIDSIFRKRRIERCAENAAKRILDTAYDRCTHRSAVNGFCLAPRCMCGQQDIRNSINTVEGTGN